jgi:Protein of unknown function (DUF3313)
MSMKPLVRLLALLAALGGCAQLDDWSATVSGRDASPVAKDVSASQARAVYVNSDEAAGSRDFRNVYIAPANLANMQVIQPEGATADIEWWVTDAEAAILQQAITEQFTAALGYGSAFYIVNSPEEAQIVVDTAVVAIHPNVSRAAVASRSSTSGAITVSIALVNARSRAVLVRVVDTRATDDIWAFNQVDAGDAAYNPVFRTLGDSMRLGLLQLQER